jgi:hypothetical protein
MLCWDLGAGEPVSRQVAQLVTVAEAMVAVVAGPVLVLLTPHEPEAMVQPESSS